MQIRKKPQDLKIFWLAPETCFGLFHQISFEEVNLFTKSRFYTALVGMGLPYTLHIATRGPSSSEPMLNSGGMDVKHKK